MPIRYGRMLVSPFTFYRGAALIMAADLAGTPRLGHHACSCAATPTCRTSACSRSPERRLVFDINDFDETLPGPWEWDVKRLAASLEVAGRDNGFTAKQRDAVVAADGAASTATAMRRFAGDANLDVWYAHLDVEAELDASCAAAVRRSGAQAGREHNVAKARTRDSMHAFSQAHRTWSTASRGSSATRR